MLDHILLAVDGSDGSRRAVAFAHKLLGPATRITVLVAIEPPSAVLFGPFDAYIPSAQHPSPERVAAAHALIDALAAELGRDRVHARVELGAPGDVICHVADELAVDLIVIGARGLNPAARWLLGSVSEKVVRHATRPVTVVR